MTTAGEVDARRIQAHLSRFATYTDSADDTDGVTRLAYTATERRAHDHFAAFMRGLGLEVHTDAAGNTIAELAGTDPQAPALATGSHLDSVPRGGRFDGIAGVCAAMEIAAVRRAHPDRPRRTWRFVAFAAEEGARFGQACNGSRMVAGLTGSQDAHELRDADGISMAAAMREIGLDPSRIEDCRWEDGAVAAFLELHIEQGTVLESHRTPIGIVDSISGSSRLRIQVDGQPSHSGGTPMDHREDALACAAECVLVSERVATDFRHHGTRVTVGRLDVAPNSITTIPGSVMFSVDVRDLDGQRQRETVVHLLQAFEAISARRGIRLRSEVIGDTSPVVLPTSLVTVGERSARAEGVTSRRLPSGASHDAQQIGRIAPAGMIFVPSRHGVSHVPEEWTDAADIATGTRVLLRSLETLDDVA